MQCAAFAWAPCACKVLGSRGYRERHVFRVGSSPQYQFQRSLNWQPRALKIQAISQELVAREEEDNFRFNGVQIDSTQIYGDTPVSQDTLSVHGGEREGRPRVSDSLTTPIVQTATYTFRDTEELIAYQEGRYGSYEYGRYGNPTTRTCEEKIRILEGAEDCLVSSKLHHLHSLRFILPHRSKPFDLHSSVKYSTSWLVQWLACWLDGVQQERQVNS